MELPEKKVKIRYVDMDPETRQAYRKYDLYTRKKYRQLTELETRISTSRDMWKKKKYQYTKKKVYNQIFMMLTRMRMICCHQFMKNYQSNFLTQT